MPFYIILNTYPVTSIEKLAERTKNPAPKERALPTAASLRREGDVDDLVLEDAARHLDLHFLADLLAQQALPARAGRQDLVVVVVFLAGADQLVHLELPGIQVPDPHAGAEYHGVLRQGRLIDNVRPGQRVLQRVDP